MKNEISQDELKSILNYDPETGLFTWIRSKLSRLNGMIAGYSSKSGYVEIRINYILYRSHQLAWIYENGQIDEGKEIDHMNGDKSDNRIVNLRMVTRRTNMENRVKASAKNSTGNLGVSWDKVNNKWVAQIGVSGKNIKLGRYLNPEDAHQSYLSAKRKYHAGCTI